MRQSGKRVCRRSERQRIEEADRERERKSEREEEDTDRTTRETNTTTDTEAYYCHPKNNRQRAERFPCSSYSSALCSPQRTSLCRQRSYHAHGDGEIKGREHHGARVGVGGWWCRGYETGGGSDWGLLSLFHCCLTSQQHVKCIL